MSEVTAFPRMRSLTMRRVLVCLAMSSLITSDIPIGASDPVHETVTLNGHTNQVMSVAFSPDGARIASGSGDKTVKLWDVGPLKPER